MTTIEIIFYLYLVIGSLLGTIGPGGKNILEEIKRARGSPLVNAVMERAPPSELKLMLFRVVVTIGFIVLWPLFIYGIVKEQREHEISINEIENKLRQGLWFQYNMGGCGTLLCNECHASEGVTSFIHGINSSTTGFQCQACGKLASIQSGGPGHANEYAQELICECGGELSRDKVVFCPTCKSKNMTYQIEFIT